MNISPLRLRIALLSTLLSGAVMLAFGSGALWVVARQKTESLDARIRALASRQPGWLFRDRDFRRLEEQLDFVLGGSEGPEAYFLLVADPDGKVLHQSAGWPAGLDPARWARPWENTAPAAPLPPAEETQGPGRRGWGGGPGRGRGGGQAIDFSHPPEFSSFSSAGKNWRIGRMGGSELTWVIGLNADPQMRELEQLRKTTVIALPVSLVLIGLGGWVVAGMALRPIRNIAETVSGVSARGLDQRIPPFSADPEITRLVDMLNGMMDRLEAGFIQATRFSADASHELKTPLAILRGELEQALQQARPGSDEQRVFTSLLEETNHLGRIVRSLLLLSRADAGRLVTHKSRVDLSRLLAELLEDATLAAESAGLRLEHELAPGVFVSGDESLLRTALFNLLTNAIKHNDPGGRVFARLERREDGGARLEIANTGPPLAAEEQAEIFERFRRGRAARDQGREGSGLGLSLAREILLAHAGNLELVAGPPDDMIRFAATFAPEH